MGSKIVHLRKTVVQSSPCEDPQFEVGSKKTEQLVKVISTTTYHFHHSEIGVMFTNSSYFYSFRHHQVHCFCSYKYI